MSKPGRNDPCPCGSGKKFKKCCELKAPKTILSSAQILPSSGKVASLFQRNVSIIQSKPPTESPDEKDLNM